MPIEIPDGVTLAVDDNRIFVKGAKGELSQDYHGSVVTINLEDKV